MQIFIVSDDVQQALRELRTYAEQHPFSKQEMEARELVPNWAPCDMDDFTREFAPATKIVFTVETTRSGRLVRHLSVSINGSMPHPFIVDELLPVLGFRGLLADQECLVDFSEEPRAINILQPLS